MKRGFMAVMAGLLIGVVAEGYMIAPIFRLIIALTALMCLGKVFEK